MSILVVAALASAAARNYSGEGLVLAVDRSANTVTISHGRIAGLMEPMVMPFHVPRGNLPAALHQGNQVTFTLRVDRAESWIENIRVVDFHSTERDPVLAGRLAVMDRNRGAVALGSPVADFTLTDQSSNTVALSSFKGKVVALDFIYTRCPLPDYCFRLSNNFSRLQTRFRNDRDLVLLTVTFDPARDVPEALARYAEIWKADLSRWHFLTGTAEDVRRVCEQFGVAYWPDEGLFTHSLRTEVIDRDGRLAANLEGNRFTAKQLGDLVEMNLRRSAK